VGDAAQADGLAGSSMLEELSTPSRVGAGLVAMALLWWAAGGSPGEVLTLEEEALHAYVRTPQGSFAVGCVASFFAEMLTCPLDTIKVRMQLTCNMPGEAGECALAVLTHPLLTVLVEHGPHVHIGFRAHGNEPNHNWKSGLSRVQHSPFFTCVQGC